MRLRGTHITTAALAATALVAAAAPAAAQTLSYTLKPAYAEGRTGQGGWSRVPVGVTYACTAPRSVVVVACPPAETLGADLSEAGAPFVRNAVFMTGQGIVVNRAVTLMAAPGQQLLGVDGLTPSIGITAPRAGATYDAGSVVAAAYALRPERGPAAQSVAGPVPSGAPLDTGAADTPATWGPRTFTVTASDAAGNRSSASVSYVVDELPGAATPVAPADGAKVGRRPVLTWTMSADDGTGPARARVELVTASGTTMEYDDVASPQMVGDDLPVGDVRWRVVTVDARSRTAAGAWRTMRVSASPAPPVVTALAATSAPGVPQPSFAWTGLPGAAFAWTVLAAGREVVPATFTWAASAQAPQPLVPGDYVFRVRQLTEAGGAGPWSPDLAFAVAAPPPLPPPPPPSAQTATLPALPARAPGAGALPSVRAAQMRPRAGARVTPRPLLRWSRVKGATLYNVQLYRRTTTGYAKVLSVFPRANRMRVPSRRLAAGSRYVWRVWPYMARQKRFRARPVGVSWFRVVPARRG